MKKDKTTDFHIKMTEMLELSDKDFYVATIKILQGAIMKTLDKLREMLPCSSGPRSRFIASPDRTVQVWAGAGWEASLGEGSHGTPSQLYTGLWSPRACSL